MKKTKKTALTAAAFAAAMGLSACPVNLAADAVGIDYFMKRMDNAGDINSDGKLNLTDIVFLYKYLKNQQPMTEEEFYRADINEDGYVNIYDFVMQKQLLLFYPEEIPAPLYGPPPELESDTTETEYQPVSDTPEDVYGPPDWYETESEILPQPDYGPPPIWETDMTEITETTPETVYGPPVWFDPKEEETDPTEEITETTTEYQPETDEPVCVYGPPEYFGITENPEE